jgi:hypothetical protein
MPKNTESLNRTLFELLHSKGLDPTMLSTSGKEIPTPEEAEVFQFNFVKDGEDYGTVTISIDGLRKLTIYFSDEVANSEKEESESDDVSWYQLLNQLKKFSQKYQLSFELRNVSNLKHDMAKREYMKKKESIAEGYYPMGRKASYSDAVPSVKIVLQHSRQIEEGEQRYRNVERIFLENEQGERFLAPTTRPGIARVYARHIAEGGKPHDDRWNHIGSLCEEYSKMAGFVRATRNGQFTESTQKLIAEGINHYQSLRESLGKLAGHRGYNAYFESWTPPLMEDDSDMSNINELFVQETVDPRIESVMPILSKLQKKISEMSEVNELSEWADKLIEGDEDIADNQTSDDIDNAESELTEEESLTSNNPQGVPEGMMDTVKKGVKAGAKALDRFVTGGDKEDLLRDLKDKAGVRNPQNGKPSMAYSDVEKRTDEVDMGQADSSLRNQPKQNNDKMDHFTALGKASKKMGHDHYMDVPDDKLEALKAMVKRFRAGEEVDEANIQPTSAKSRSHIGSLSNPTTNSVVHPSSGKEIGLITKQPNGEYYAHPSSTALAHSQGATFASKDEAHQFIRNAHAKAVKNGTLSKNWLKSQPLPQFAKGQGVAESEFAGDYATGEAGQWRNKGPKANKPATIGDLVGESDGESTTHKGGKVAHKDGVTKHQSGPGTYGGYDASTHPDSPEEKHKQRPGAKTGHSTDQIQKFKFSEGQDDLDTIRRLVRK